MIASTVTITYRVTGTLLATRDARCYLHGLDLADVAHDEIAVDLIVRASSSDRASDAAWIAASDYTTWRWREAPVVEEVIE